LLCTIDIIKVRLLVVRIITENISVATANYVLGKKLKEDSKSCYRGKIGVMKAFLAHESRTGNFGEYLDEGSYEMKLPLPEIVVKELFGWLARNTDSDSKEKHVYANPLQPTICSLLALAVFFLCRQRTYDQSVKIKSSIYLF
jgi:hypothetical protein